MAETWIERRYSNRSEQYRFALRDDIPDIARMLSDPEVSRWLWFTPLPAEGAEAFFGPLVDLQVAASAEGRAPSPAEFVVEDSEGGFLGQGAAIPVEGSPGGHEIGFQLTRAAWGRGVGTRLGTFLLAYAVHVLGAERIEAACIADNAASVALISRLGLRPEGCRVAYRLVHGVRRDECLFGALVADLDAAAIESAAHGTGLLST